MVFVSFFFLGGEVKHKLGEEAVSSLPLPDGTTFL